MNMKGILKYVFILFSFYSSFCMGQNQAAKMDRFISNLLNQMTLEEKLGQINLSSGSMGTVGNGESLSEVIRNGKIGATGGFFYDAVKKIQDAAQESRQSKSCRKIKWEMIVD
jgi:beta-glucosidase